jgi:hypothetical protein
MSVLARATWHNIPEDNILQETDLIKWNTNLYLYSAQINNNIPFYNFILES